MNVRRHCSPHAVCAITLPFVLACAGGAGTPTEDPTPVTRCDFINPVGAGADPWVIWKDDVYYSIRSSSNKIWIARSATLTDVYHVPATAVWAASDTGWNRGNVWAPELHFIDGRWYIYYAAGQPGAPFTTQHAGVLQSTGPDALGA